MNRIENWFCSTQFWQRVTQKQILPWVLSSADLGDHLVEVGAGAGAATIELQRRVARVTSIEYSFALAARIADRTGHGAIVQGDASDLPFADRTFSSAIAVLVMHHLRSPQMQTRAITEIHRVLKPGGTFLALEIRNSWLNRAFHFKSTFVPLQPDSLPERLTGIGFDRVMIDQRNGAFRLFARRS